MQINAVSGEAVEAAIKVHSTLGPGLMESVYETCLVHELRKRGLHVLQQVRLPIIYDGIQLNADYRLDLLVEEVLVIELKAVESVLPLHKAQLLSYLRLSGKQLGLLLNFNVVRMRDGIWRIVNHLPEPLDEFRHCR